MPTHEENTNEAPFPGYTSPNYTQVPDELFDHQLPDLSGAELKVLLYIMRRTFGFKKDADDISLNQICRGITTKDGRVLDRGTGLSKSTAQIAIKGLLAKNVILTTKRVSKEKGNEATTYELNVPSRRPYADFRHRGAIPISDTALYRKSAQQETVVQQTDLDLSNFEGSHDQLPPESRGGTEPRPVAPEAAPEPPRGAPNGRGHGEPMPLGQILRSRATRTARSGAPPAGGEAGQESAPRHRRGRGDADPDDRERLRPFLEDFARELGDEAPLSSTITRTLTIFAAAGIPPEQWGDLLYRARGLTQEHTAQIRKTAAAGGGGQVRGKNKMPYFLATLEQLAGLRPEPPHRGKRNAGTGAEDAT